MGLSKRNYSSSNSNSDDEDYYYDEPQQQQQQQSIKKSIIPNSQFSKQAQQSNFQDLYCNSNTWSTSNYHDTKIINSNRVQEKQIQAITEHPNSKEVKIKLPLKDWLDYLKENSDRQTAVPFSIEKSTYKAKVECLFEIVVFNNTGNNNNNIKCGQIQIPLLPSTVCITSSNIQFLNKSDENESCIGIYQDAHSLFCDKVGKYTVELDVLANFLTPKKNGVGIAIPRSTFNHLEICVPKKVNIDVVEPIVRDNPDHLKYEQQQQGDKQQPQTHTIKNCPFQPTNYLKIQWTDIETKSEQVNLKINQIDLSSSSGSGSKDKAPVVGGGVVSTEINKPIEATKLNVEQHTLCSVGEGVIMITSIITYTVVSGSASSFDILVGNNIKVLSVDGNNIKRWEVTSPQLVEITPELGGSNTKDQLIKVQLTSSVETSYRLSITAEIEMESTSGTVYIPKGIRCSGIEISREKGFLVVESTANVEVEQMGRENLTLIDKTELPSQLVSLSSGPLLLSYKFLVPKYSLTFKVIKHQDLSVLVAFCPGALFTATCSSEGALLTKCEFTIRNEQQQYLRVTIPHQFEIWSTIVASKAVKPAVDDQGCLMIPLNKSSGSSQGIQKTFKVELVYKHVRDFEFLNAGTFSIVFPQIDIPISTLQISLHLPSAYKYGEFTGNAKEINRFLKNIVDKDDDDNDYCAAGALPFSSNVMPQQMMIPPPQMMSQSNSLTLDSIHGGGGGTEESHSIMGLKPIKVNIPSSSGQSFKLEQLLVISTEIKLQVPYKLKKSFC